ncbi:MAG: 30S ribosomal protein S18 [Acidobacteriota bacterium]
MTDKKESSVITRRYFAPKKKYCKFCFEKIDYIDFKNVNLIEVFLQDRGKILSRRITGICAYHQRELAKAIKRARHMALLPFLPE